MAQNINEQDKRNAEKLTEIVKWSLENKKLWLKLSCTPELEITVGDAQTLLEEFRLNGFMELYYLSLARIGCIMDICINSPNYVNFLQAASGYEINLEIT